MAHDLTGTGLAKTEQRLAKGEVMSQEEYPGQTLVTKDHDVIRQWGEERNAVPATVPGSRHGDHVGVLRFDFPGYGGERLEHISWDEWFRTFDERNLEFVYQEHRSGGEPSNFFLVRSAEQ
ncbi:hypothetical protein [Thermasporomyces composti]|uniref:1,4-alpha-glucan branching enzyme n=1 Tax=Thermasporomyces composti TaxID=696763 RepID=A0A3D9V3Y2_THECX|nr:hypothetical protein [Thermasporomyces composti]REF36189.1 hypothetical protein DFJ64_1589 [Thermasporomyces composti]